MNHTGRRMCTHSTLRLHITHLLQRRIFFFPQLYTTGSTYVGYSDVITSAFQKKKNWISIISWRRVLYQKDDWLLVCWTTLLLHTGRITGLFNCDGISKVAVVADFLSLCTRNDTTSQDSRLRTENRRQCFLNAKQKGWRLNSNIRCPEKKLSCTFVHHKGLLGYSSYS